MADPLTSGLRAELGRRLRVIRRNAGLSGPGLADRLGFSQSKISRIENGQLWPPVADFTAWLDACNVTETAERDHVLSLVSGVEYGVTAYREVNRGALANRQRELIDMDAAATQLRQFSPMVVSGLLHTFDYARACLIASNYSQLADIDEAARTRVERGAQLRDAEPETRARVHLILTEAALRWVPVDTPAEPAAVLRNMLNVAATPNFTVQIIPTGTPMPALPQCSFMLVDWPDPDERSIVIVETPAAELIFSGADEVGDFEAQWHAMRQVALNPDESTAFLRGLVVEYPPPSPRGDNT